MELDISDLRGRFANLEKTLPTNLKTNRGLDNLLNEFKHYLKSLPHLKDQIPKTWFKVREALETEANEHDHIDLVDYRAICRDNGLDHKQDQLQLSGYLHDLGACLHFQDDFILKQIVILKPTWGTDAVYRVLDNEQVKQNQGRFSDDELELIWAEDKYAAKLPVLLQLMMKFQLCYALPDEAGVYIAPHLLSKKKPTYDWDDAENLLLRYEYKFMPKGIISRFIVVMHRHIEQQAYVWHSGIILKKDDTRAEVIEYYDGRELRIRIMGRHKRDLMMAITDRLAEIHQSYPRLKYSKLVPCNCSRCKDSQNPYFYEFESLRSRLTAGRHEVECDKSYQFVSVRSLIDDIGGQIEGRNDDPEVKHKRNMLKSHQQRLRVLEVQKAEFGIDVPAHIVAEIKNIDAKIKQLKADLGLR